jgi:hypothetical protein
MAFISINQFRIATGVDAATMADDMVGMFLGAASAMIYGLTGRNLGHVAESLVANGADIDILAYGHMMLPSGRVYVVDSGSALDGIHQYVKIDENNVKLLNVTLPAGVVRARLCPHYLQDLSVMESRVRPRPTPVALIDEVRVDFVFTGGDAFDESTIVAATDYYVPEDGDSTFNSEIELAPKYGMPIKRRMPGYINPVRQASRRIARTSFFAGTLRDVPPDLVVAISAIARQVASDPSGEFSSESYDYYSYSRRSIEELTRYPTSAISTILRYRVGGA